MARSTTKEKKSTEVAQVKNTEVADMEALGIYGDAGVGNEDLGRKDVLIPRLKIAQALSPQVKKSKPEYIDGCEDGSVFISGMDTLLGTTDELAEKPILLVPVFYRRRFIEWIPRDSGGGLVNPDHDESITEEAVKGEKGKMILPNGNEISDTPEHYVLLVHEDGSYDQLVMSMSATQARVSRAWNTQIRNLRITNPANGLKINPARFYGSYNAWTIPESNDQGDWFNWKIKYAGPIVAHESGNGVDVYRAAKEFYTMIMEGEIRVDHERDGMEAGPSNTKEADENI